MREGGRKAKEEERGRDKERGKERSMEGSK